MSTTIHFDQLINDTTPDAVVETADTVTLPVRGNQTALYPSPGDHGALKVVDIVSGDRKDGVALVAVLTPMPNEPAVFVTKITTMGDPTGRCTWVNDSATGTCTITCYGPKNLGRTSLFIVDPQAPPTIKIRVRYQ